MNEHLNGRPWSQTVSGRAFPLIEPAPEDVHWPDIVYALAHLHRFCGAAGHYSVAQHTVFPLHWVPDEVKPYWLLHDAHEFVLGDLPRPMQVALTAGDFRLEKRIHGLRWGIDRAIYQAAGLEWPLPEAMHKAIKQIDDRMLMTEQRDLFGAPPADWGVSAEPYPSKIEPWTPAVSYSLLTIEFDAWFDIHVPTMPQMLIDVAPSARVHGAVINKS